MSQPDKERIVELFDPLWKSHNPVTELSSSLSSNMTSHQNYISTNPTLDIGPSVSALNRMTPKNFEPKNKDITFKKDLRKPKSLLSSFGQKQA